MKVLVSIKGLQMQPNERAAIHTTLYSELWKVLQQALDFNRRSKPVLYTTSVLGNSKVVDKDMLVSIL